MLSVGTDVQRLARLRDALVPQPAPVTDLVAAAAGLLTTSGGHLSVDALAKAHQVSRQHFTRRFRAATGLPPKQFARICRFQRLLHTLLTTDVDRWAAEATGLGFYDQAHMINDFREFAGESPTRFFQPHGEGGVAVPAAQLRGRPHEWLRSGDSA
jgi:methylphosphotriester-DNA--protein-cysteine methyltransferase